MTSTDPATNCAVCQHYLSRRIRVLAPQVCLLADQRHLPPPLLLGRYLGSVHARHLAGESLSTRPVTGTVKSGEGMRLTIQRACNGCQRSLGDARPDELDAAEAGRALPDVTLECGCHGRAA